MTRRLYAARPCRIRIFRYFAEPGPIVTEFKSTVRAAGHHGIGLCVRNSIMCFLSRLEPKDGIARFALAIFPSAVIARFRNTKGQFARLFRIAFT